MKIGFVVDDTLDKPDGVQQYVLTLSAWLKSQGHEVHYLVGESSRSDIENIHSLSKNVKVRFNKNRLTIPLPSSGAKMKQLVESEKFDVLHVQMPHNPLLAAKIVKYSPPQTAIVGTFHIAPFSKLETAATRTLGIIMKQNLKLFDQIISVSSAAQLFAKKTFKVDSIVLPNVVDIQKFKTSPRREGKPQITFLGRLVERKGCEHLLYALAIMEKQNPELNYSFRICSDGPDREKLLKLVKTLKLKCHFDFTGYVSEEEKKRFLSMSDIAVFPSTGGESFGIVLIEAMAAGAGVVIGGDNPGYRTVLGELPETLVNPLDHEALAATLTKFLTDKKLAQKIHDQQQELVERFDVRYVGPKIVAVYEESIAKRHAQTHN